MISALTKLATLGLIVATATAGTNTHKTKKPEAARAKTATQPTTRPATTAPSRKAPPKNIAPLPVKLPKPTVVGTPKNPPPGVRIKISRDKWRPRKPFMAPKGCVNVARGKQVSASDNEPVIGRLSQVADGDREACYGSLVELGLDVQWVQIDLGQAHKIQAIVAWHEHRHFVVYHDVIVQVSDDKDFIENVRTLFNNDHDNSAGMGLGKDWEYFETYEGKLFPAKAIRARYVRLYSNGNTSTDLNRYTEIDVYAVPAGAKKAAKTNPTRKKRPPTQ